MSQAQYEQSEGYKNASVLSYAWVILAVVYIASVAAALNQNKVPPIMPVLIEGFGISLSQAGLLMSIFSITGLVLALPAGVILQRLGAKVTGLIAMASLVIGSALGAMAGGLPMLLTSRVIEGVGLGLIAIVAPAVISFWFPPQKQGTPMGIWATWMPVGIILMLLIAPWLGLTTGWQSVWWFGAIFALVALVLYALLLRMPPGMAELDAAMETPPLRQALANRDIWFLGLAFCCFNWVFMPITTYYVTFLTEMRGFSLAGASQVVLLSTVAALISAPVSGLLSDRIGSRKRFLTIPFLLLAVMLLLPFRVEGWQIFVYMAIQGLVAGVVPPATFAAAPEVMSKPQLAGIGLAVVMLGQNLGMFVAPVIFGAMVEATSWTVAGLGLIPMALLGFFAARQVRVR